MLPATPAVAGSGKPETTNLRGGSACVKLTSGPYAVPSPCVAPAQKKEVVFALKPAAGTEYLWRLLEAPTSTPPVAGTRVPNAFAQVPGFAVPTRKKAL